MTIPTSAAATAITVLKAICKDGVGHFERVSQLVYRRQPEDGRHYIKPHMAQGISLAKGMFYIAVAVSILATCASSLLLDLGLISSLYYPVFGVIMVGEIYYYLDGPLWDPEESSLSGEADRATKVTDYTFLRRVLSRNFGDKLMSDNTSVNSDLLRFKTNGELVEELMDRGTPAEEAYGLFMKKQATAGLEIDQNYLASGLALLGGKSTIFNNPFYYDLIPYIFYPMNRTILRRKKVLIVLGRHAIEKDIEKWANDGLESVTHIPGLWKVEVLGAEAKNPDVGIITRSSVHDLKMHENNAQFFADVEFVMLIEPSRLVATAQIGLNSLIRHCRKGGQKPVFCTADKNCDGLVDALSHILMTSLEEVTATNKHRGVSSYMCWEADQEHLQHRMMPNLSRYLGVGTELSFVALKNQISQTGWYGGDGFPVLDMHWIAKQYYYDLLKFASLPTDQVTFDEVFKTSANMWSAKVRENAYLTVEDENFNMYEAKRAFATRSTEQGFVNVVSTDYLLKDYMAANDGIFEADSKAIPYIVADYAHTPRNVVYRLCQRLASYPLVEDDIRTEMALLNIDLGQELLDNLWLHICQIVQGTEGVPTDEKTGRPLLRVEKNRSVATFDVSVIERDRRYSFQKGKMEQIYFIRNKRFISMFLSDLLSAEYVAEDETDTNRFLGTELQGHVFQKYLPGQFFTFGGKYYEMVRLALDGRVLVRRAADHIDGRPQYRQVRNYTLRNTRNSPQMGDQRQVGGVQVTKQYADIQVDTPAYWRMRRYHDFRTAKKVCINGVPTRQYFNKQLLRIDFPAELVPDRKTLDTVALLMNEVFRTLYAENQCMIVAVTPGQAVEPLTYSVEGEGLCSNSLYIIEDSQMDIGFLVSVERNLTRIFSIICDYLQWHFEALEASRNPPKPVEPDSFVIDDATREAEAAEEAEKKKQKGIRGFFRRIGDFFRRLFKRKPKGEKPEKKKKEKKKKDKKLSVPVPEPVSVAEAPAEQTPVEEIAVEAPVEEIAVEAPEAEITMEAPEAEITMEAPAEEIAAEAPVEETAEEATTEEPAEEAPAQEASEEEEHPVLFNMAPPRKLFNLAPPEAAPVEEAPVEEIPEAPVEEIPEAEMPEAPVEEIPEAEMPEAPAEEVPEAEVSVEPDGAKKPERIPDPVRKPYHTRYYLLFGGEQEPENLDPMGVLQLLQGLGFGNSSLEQARRGPSETENVEKNFLPDCKGIRYCDFCGSELFGSEYEILADGRERCTVCSRTAVKSEKEFKKIYQDVIRNLSAFFGITISAPVKIQMVNAKALHKHLGKSFVPTAEADGRVLGVAIRDKKNNYSILLENGSPRLSATMTMVHELTHIWQYLNWDASEIKHLYGNKQNLEVYEGMAKWVEIQYAYLINEKQTAKREEIITSHRDDPYGHGFVKYVSVYPLSTGIRLLGDTPFNNPKKPL